MNKRAVIGLFVILILVVGLYFYGNYDPSEYKLFPKCVFHTLTGYKCPGCGSQRALHSLIHGNYQTAFLYNPLLFCVIPYVILGMYIEYVADPDKPSSSKIKRTFYTVKSFVFLGILILIYTIVRNIYDFSPQ